MKLSEEEPKGAVEGAVPAVGIASLAAPSGQAGTWGLRGAVPEETEGSWEKEGWEKKRIKTPGKRHKAKGIRRKRGKIGFFSITEYRGKRRKITFSELLLATCNLPHCHPRIPRPGNSGYIPSFLYLSKISLASLFWGFISMALSSAVLNSAWIFRFFLGEKFSTVIRAEMRAAFRE